MDADQGNVVVDGRLGGGADRISDLPDHLLHRILICLRSTANAARTSVLSRRWHRVWTHLPELVLRCCSPEHVDAALAAWSAPVLHRLLISVLTGSGHIITAEHVSSWLRFASERLAGELRLLLPLHEKEVVLPVCGRFTAISLANVDYLGRLRLRFQVRPAGGVFTSLAALTIGYASMESRELEELVMSSRCPRLKELVLENIILQLCGDHILSIRSDTIEKLRVSFVSAIHVEDDRRLQLQVATPELQEFSLNVRGEAIDGHIATPKLSKVCWTELYDPRRHHLVEAGRHLKRLQLTSRSLALLGRFDAVDELDLDIFLSQGAEGYMRILEDTSKIRCEVLLVTFLAMPHAFEPIMLHLLRKCIGIRKLVVEFKTRMPYPCKLSGCPCNLAHDHLTNGILLDSLQEVVVKRAGDTKQVVEIVGLLCRCSETFQKKVHITISQGNRLRSMDMRRRIDILLSAPNNKVEVTIH